jgi:6-phosphogluconolactonase
MRLISLFFLLNLVCLIIMNFVQSQTIIYLGSYSNIITAFSFSESTGNLSLVNITSDNIIDNPSWVTISSSKKYLYAVSEIDNFNGTYSGAVSSFAINSSSYELTFINKVSTSGAAPCHIAASLNDDVIYLSNYCSGSVSVIRVNSDGSLGSIIQLIDHNSIPAVNCGDSSSIVAHAHEIVLDHVTETAYCSDLGK